MGLTSKIKQGSKKVSKKVREKASKIAGKIDGKIADKIAGKIAGKISQKAISDLLKATSNIQNQSNHILENTNQKNFNLNNVIEIQSACSNIQKQYIPCLCNIIDEACTFQNKIGKYLDVITKCSNEIDKTTRNCKYNPTIENVNLEIEGSDKSIKYIRTYATDILTKANDITKDVKNSPRGRYNENTQWFFYTKLIPESSDMMFLLNNIITELSTIVKSNMSIIPKKTYKSIYTNNLYQFYDYRICGERLNKIQHGLTWKH